MRPERTRTQRSNLSLGIAAVVLLVIVGLSYREWRQYAAANVEAARARETIDTVNRLLLSLIDAETGQRGFLLTGETRYLEPYNQAIREIQPEMASLTRLLAALPDESETASSLSALVAEKLRKLSEAIALRQTQGFGAALDVVLSDQGRRTMDQIRAICSGIQARLNSVQNKASIEREAAARTTLVVTISGALILLFFFVIGLNPIAGTHLKVTEKPRLLVHGAAFAAIIVAILLRMALTPLIGDNTVPFITFFPAVLFSSWFGGFRVGVLSVLLSALASDYYFVLPTHSLLIRNAGDQITLLIFLVVGFGMALLSHSQRLALQRADSEASLRKITLASIGDAVIATDAEGRISFMNGVAESLTGWTLEEASLKELGEVFHVVSEETGRSVENPAARAMEEGGVVGLANHTVLVSKDGTERPIDDSGAPIKDAQGRTIGAVLIFRDITERRRLQRTKDEFLAMVSHELRTPLTSILGWAAIMRSRRLRSEETSHALEVIERNARAEAALVESLLDLSRLNAGKLKPESERMNLTSVVVTAADSLKPSADARGINLDAEVPPEPLFIVGDGARLQQVFSNLISNAIKFTPSGGRIHVRLSRKDSRAVIQVADNGEGISLEFLPHVFDRFRQAESATARAHGGLGLGLAIVRELVQAHGGTVTAESPGKGRGSTFTVTLPIPDVQPP
jgi:PAS domain S-box-containing protein